MTAAGLRFVRRSHAGGYHYFIVNRADKPFAGILPLAVPFQSAVVLDPWDASHTGIALPQACGALRGIALQLAPGQSIIVRTFSSQSVAGKPWTLHPANMLATPLTGPWRIQFIAGGPQLPAPASLLQTGSWTQLPDAGNFSGTARYSTTFELPAPLPATCLLDLGCVANTARVAVNGHSLGISWCAPHLVELTQVLRAGMNLLEVEVTNLAANRIADLDRRKQPWKQFHEVNFVNIDYQPFDASGWPVMDSGLLGPVRLLVPPVSPVTLKREIETTDFTECTD